MARAGRRSARARAIAVVVVAAVLIVGTTAGGGAKQRAQHTPSVQAVDAVHRALGSPPWRAPIGDAVQASTTHRPQLTLGMDVSAHQKTVDWEANWKAGARFAYVKATEGTSYTSATFASQFAGAADVGMYRGAYHFATPNTSTGAAQARYFVAHGGQWRDDGRTLPPMLDIETDYRGGDACWNTTPAAMVRWIRSFSNTVAAETGVRPVIYTTKNWWKACTNASDAFTDQPLFVADPATTDYAEAVSIPGGWARWTFWQWGYGDGPFDGDSDALAADVSLRELASGNN